jgi:hypothetical protein
LTSPRPYVVAAAAAVMAAVYFVPSAHATQQDDPGSARTSAVTGTGTPGELADTGAMNTKPYLIGGSGFLVVGAGLLVNAARRSRQEADAADEPEAES